MKPKTIVTTILLLFVAASVTYLAVGALWKSPDIKTAPAVPTATAPLSTGSPATDPSAADPLNSGLPATDPVPASLPDTYVNVYYFHGTYRCISCRTIEMYTREAINEGFLAELGDGSLHMRVLNMQDPENEAYVNDFGLEYYIVVLEKVVDGKRVEFKKLEGVWDLYNDKPAFKKYVIGETRNYLKGI